MEHRPTSRHWALLSGLIALTTVSCRSPHTPPLAARPGSLAQGITDPVLRRERCEAIRDTCAEKGVTLGYLFGGIGEAETSLSHCNSEVGYGCPGPASPSCNGEPILAGGADGPCSAEQGGLGMFQFDAGTYADTLALYGDAILTFEGNVAQAVEYMIERVKISVYIDNVSTREEAIAWINSAEYGTNNYEIWIKTVTHYYNGCVPGSCSVYDQRYDKYDTSTERVLNEFEDGFWGNFTPPAPCTLLAAAGGTLEEDGPCFVKGGDPQYWFNASDGHGGHLIYTHTTDNLAVNNYGRWEIEPTSAGTYDVEVFVDPDYSETHHAKYVVTHENGTNEIEIDQSTADGFVLLGSFPFAATGDEKSGQSVFLGDATGEPWNNGETMISFDAVRVLPTGSHEETIDGDGGASDGGGAGDSDTVSRDAGPPGCAATGSVPAASGIVLALAARRRRRRR